MTSFLVQHKTEEEQGHQAHRRMGRRDRFARAPRRSRAVKLQRQVVRPVGDPGMNHKVFLDMQLNLLANDPSCFGLYGVMTYLSSYTDEETVRWMGRLFRHYCIEGRTEPVSRDPLALGHLRNPDFEEGTRAWTVTAARSRPGFSWLQGRYPKTSQGATATTMDRSTASAEPG